MKFTNELIQSIYREGEEAPPELIWRWKGVEIDAIAIATMIDNSDMERDFLVRSYCNMVGARKLSVSNHQVGEVLEANISHLKKWMIEKAEALARDIESESGLVELHGSGTVSRGCWIMGSPTYKPPAYIDAPGGDEDRPVFIRFIPERDHGRLRDFLVSLEAQTCYSVSVQAIAATGDKPFDTLAARLLEWFKNDTRAVKWRHVE